VSFDVEELWEDELPAVSYWGVSFIPKLERIYGWGIWERDRQRLFTGETDEEWEVWEHRYGHPWEGHIQQGTGPCLACRGVHLPRPSIQEEASRLLWQMQVARHRRRAEETDRKIEEMIERAERVFQAPLHF
jgi:hypothetical protein